MLVLRASVVQKMANKTCDSSSLEKLKGSENYHTWKFAMRNLLEFHDLDQCIKKPCVETDDSKLKKAKARLVLSINESLYVHIQSFDNASDIWEALEKLFDDRGLSRQISLLRQLLGIKLENSESMADYVTQIIDTANKLKGIGFTISDEMIGAILLAGLSDEFKPLIMGLESSGIKVTSDAVKSKLLEGDYEKKISKSAFFTTKKGYKPKKSIKCYNCGEKNHVAKDCTKKKNNSKDKSKLLNDKNKSPNDQNKSLNGTKAMFRAVCLSSNQEYVSNDWYLDSGASNHVTPKSSWLHNQRKSSISSITIANGDALNVTNAGDCNLTINDFNVKINNVVHVPDSDVNLLSVSKIAENGNTIMFKDDICKVYTPNDELIAETKAVNGVYKFKSDGVKTMYAGEKPDDFMTWHRRLGHLNCSDLNKMKNGVVDGVYFDEKITKIDFCQACIEAKQTRAPFGTSASKSENLLELIHSDLCGPMENTSVGGAKYFITYIDDFSRKIFMFIF